jgi:four helix bundle protein
VESGKRGEAMKFERFEDILAWQKARVLVDKVYGTFENSKDWGFNDQIQRAAVSIMNNIAEGFEKKSNADFVKFLYISKGSCGEVRSMLYVALDLHKISQTQFNELYALSFEISRILSGLIKSLQPE